MSMPQRSIATRLITLVALAVVAPASAQNAIGDGRVLDANPGINTGGLNTPATGTDFAARNSIVTNNVVGGRGFRGSVGYGATDEFREVTGSDDLFDFRAESAWSNVSLVNFNSTYQRFRYGQDAGVIVQYARVGQATGGDGVGSFYRAPEINDARLRLDQLSFASLTENTEQSRVQPNVVGNVYDGEGNPYVIRASALGGLERTPMNQVGELIGLNDYDFARVAEEADDTRPTGIGRAYRSSYAELLASSRVEETPADTRVNPLLLGDSGEEEEETEDPDAAPDDGRVTGDAELLAIRERVAERYAGMANGTIQRKITTELDEETVEGLEEDLRQLRLYLTGSAQREGEGVDPDDATLPKRGLGVDTSTELPPAATLDDLDPDKPLTDPRGETLDGKITEFGRILRHGERINRLTSAQDDTRFAELLASAEEALREGRYFWAERRFSRALRFTPGHPLATTGLVHTQIGAGLYLSAALTLRSLYIHQPEMIDARFAPGLLPNRPRLLDAIETLATRLEDDGDRSNSALLFAYIGRLLEEPETIARGLDVLAEDTPDDPLLPLLRAIWQGPEQPGK